MVKAVGALNLVKVLRLHGLQFVDVYQSLKALLALLRDID